MAEPNPVPPPDGSITKITWETNDPGGAEVRVSLSGEPEKLVSRGPSGSVEVSWITESQPYRFNLYGSTDPARCLDHVSVQRTYRSIARIPSQAAADTTAGNLDLDELAHFIAKAVPRCLQSTRFADFFRLWEKHGVHITPVHFYQPIPDTRTLPESLWDRPSRLVGIDMNDGIQLDLLRNCFPLFRDEYERFSSVAEESGKFHFANGRFDGTDALVTYCMVRHFKPHTMLEIGSGYSSLISGQAAARNGQPALICIEPHPLEFLLDGFPGLRSFIRKKVEEVELDFFAQLQPGDILFIDSSHTVKIGGDVNYLFLEVLPRLKPGVIVHVHDIQFPFDYRRDWVMDEFRFWTEQYLLQAFLAFNSEFEVLLCNSYLAYRYLEDFKATFPNSPWWGGGSFWMRRRTSQSSSARHFSPLEASPKSASVK